MKKKLLIATALVSISLFSLAGCSQTMAKKFGGNTTVKLEPNRKLEEITWKDDSLWYLTRPMTDNDVPETHTFQEQTNFGVFEGTVTIIETRE